MSIFATYVLAFNQDKWIMRNIENSYPHVDRIYIMYSTMPWKDNPEARSKYKNNLDLNIIKNSPYMDKITIVEGEWDSDSDERNAALKKAKEDGCDFLMVHDADEFYFHSTFEKIVKTVKDSTKYDAFDIYSKVFWKSFNHIIVNHDDTYISGQNQTIINLHKFDKYDKLRDVKTDKRYIFDEPVVCYHASYVLNDKQLYEKIFTWSHYKDFNPKEWYENKWINWNYDTRELHPIWPFAWAKAEDYYGPLPEVIEDLRYKKHDMQYMEYSYKGVHIGQVPGAYYAFGNILKDFDRIIEIGTHAGGLTLMIDELKKPESDLISYDIDLSNYQVNKLYPSTILDIRKEDCFEQKTIDEISSLIKNTQKRVLLLCDGGSKNEEFNLYSQFLKDGDVIMLHDYSDNIDDYERYCLKENWLAPHESYWYGIHESIETYNLKEFYQYDTFKSVLWGAFIKGKNMYSNRTNIINTLFEKYNFDNYLEIGVYLPENNFNYIKAKLKHSVDNLENCKDLYTHWMTSDEFFKNHVGNQKYDVIFIDGLHEYEQVYKDVKNAINHLNSNGFILLHDVNPLVEENTIPYDQFLANPISRWNGTVYKAFVRLKEELIDWSCFSVEEHSGGIGVITKRSLVYNERLNKPYQYYFKWENFDKNKQNILSMIPFNDYIKLIDNNLK
ncbi:class I SAM-dependent methyltransferase [bacterium]|jgi:hypothetical protein|nr:class I SAM-dependent methyltransferase [bacterium]